MNGTLAITRYTLLELSRRRVLLVLFALGFLGIVGIAIGLRILENVFTPGPDVSQQSLELQFSIVITGILNDFGFLIAFAIGMTAIYHDLESGAAVSIFCKPVSRLAFSVGKILAGVAALIGIVGLLAVETRLVMFLYGGGYEDTIDGEIVTVVANMIVVMLIVLTLTTWVNNIVAAVIAFVYYSVLTSVVMSNLHVAVVNNLIDNAVARDVIGVVYWLFPHPLTSDIPAALARAGTQGGVTAAGPLRGSLVTAASSGGDIAWWAFTVIFFAAVLYYAVRRRQV